MFKTIENKVPITHPTQGSCLDCEWQGDMEDADTDPCGDYDSFRDIDIPTPICPECGGGVEIN